MLDFHCLLFLICLCYRYSDKFSMNDIDIGTLSSGITDVLLSGFIMELLPLLHDWYIMALCEWHLLRLLQCARRIFQGTCVICLSRPRYQNVRDGQAKRQLHKETRDKWSLCVGLLMLVTMLSLHISVYQLLSFMNCMLHINPDSGCWHSLSNWELKNLWRIWGLVKKKYTKDM